MMMSRFYDKNMIMMKMMIVIIMVMVIIVIEIVIIRMTKRKKIVQPYFQQNCEMVVVASFSGSVRLIFILPTTEPTLWYYSA